MEALVLVLWALGLVVLAQVFAVIGRRRGHARLTWAGVVPLVAASGCLVWAIVLTAAAPSN